MRHRIQSPRWDSESPDEPESRLRRHQSLRSPNNWTQGGQTPDPPQSSSLKTSGSVPKRHGGCPALTGTRPEPVSEQDGAPDDYTNTRDTQRAKERPEEARAPSMPLSYQ
ncbi:unnamed protein product [Pleuronectes platessa]|uniref:Uncharacterized protein n=1 Tax=Pleuronectes platessa TaxID=8262 RepID=A0A9N7VD83_PLEPL|nr:unnamed protein product [Pleuronectes platessa]